MKTVPERRIRRRGDEVGLFAAAASVPRSFQSSLMKRGTVDQGIITGVSMAMAFLLGAVIQDGIDTATDSVVNARIDAGKTPAEEADKKRVQYSASASLAALGIGLAGQWLLRPKEGESTLRAAGRTGNYWLAVTGLSGLAVSGVEATTTFNRKRQKDKKGRSEDRDRSLWPFVIPLGALISMAGELWRNRDIPANPRERAASTVRAVGIGTGVAALLSAIVIGEKYVASRINKFVDTRRPEVRALKIPIGHLIGIGALGFGLYKAVQLVMHKAESSGVMLEKGYAVPPKTMLVAGSRESALRWENLSREGRRFTGSILTKAQIDTTMHSSDALDPIRVFISLEAAPTESDRVTLAMAELRRTGAFDRKILVVIQPTGTGYINYIMAETVEYLTRGDCALVGMQYSLRPSPLSIDRVAVGSSQHRMLLSAIKRELADRPAKKRPRLVLFGESLGAWTSQDAFIHQGTDGLEAMQVDNALWIGTPSETTWSSEVFGDKPRLDTDYSRVGCFGTFDQVEALSKDARDAIRFVLLTNDNDPIAKFGPKLLVQEPKWLKPGQPRPKTIPAHFRWRSPSTFVHLMIDTKNALNPTPGVFVADGHDYRANLPAFVSFTFRLNATPEELDTIRTAMEANEIARSTRTGK